MRLFAWSILFVACSVPLAAQDAGKKYPDGHGKEVFVPLGDVAFADEVVRYIPGKPAAIASASDSSLCRGLPDFDGMDGGFLTLGCGGSVVLRFTDNALINVPGIDLYVFELGKYVEKTQLSISRDGKAWIVVGEIEGGNASVDIDKAVKPGEVFNYVKLTDLKTDCKGSWPGADIDAVAAIGSGKQFNLNAEVLFDTDKALLKTKARPQIDSLAEAINGFGVKEVIISGFTDSLGTDVHNIDLSKKRAKAVQDYLKPRIKDKTITLNLFGYGEQYPVSSNSTEPGRMRNRRVEVVVIPK